jgi:hypothetical protein
MFVVHIGRVRKRKRRQGSDEGVHHLENRGMIIMITSTSVIVNVGVQTGASTVARATARGGGKERKERRERRERAPRRSPQSRTYPIRQQQASLTLWKRC